MIGMNIHELSRARQARRRGFLSDRGIIERSFSQLVIFFPRRRKNTGGEGEGRGRDIIAINQTSYRSLTRANCRAIISARRAFDSALRNLWCHPLSGDGNISRPIYIYILSSGCLFLEGARYVTCARCEMQVCPKAAL